MDIPDSKMLTAPEVAGLLRLPLPSVWGLARRGAIPVVTIGRLRRFPRAAILAIVRGEVAIAAEPRAVALGSPPQEAA